VALGRGPPEPVFHVFAAGRDLPGSAVSFSCRNLPPAQIAGKTIRRGAELFALGLLFRLQEFVVAMGWSPWTDLLRVDILNTIGLSMMLMGGFCWLVLSGSERFDPGLDRSPDRSPDRGPDRGPRTRLALVLASSGTALLISLLTPPLWTTWRPEWLPWPIESYIDGVHNLGAPQSWLFPVFPWSGFAFAGLAVGFVLQSAWVRGREARVFLGIGAVGVAIVEAARWVDAQPWHVYAVYDFWHTSPTFFLIRLGMLMAILSACYAWCRRGAGQWGFSPLIQLGQASLLVYWVHMEFVYGRLSILPKHRVGIGAASVGLLVIFLGMVALAFVRTRMKGQGGTVRGWLKLRPAAS
jgi:uncharacterized membrane protein